MADFNLGNNWDQNDWDQNQDNLGQDEWGQNQGDWDQNQGDWDQNQGDWDQGNQYNNQWNQYNNQWNQYQDNITKRGPSKKVIIGGILGGILGILVIVGIIGNIIGPPDKDNGQEQTLEQNNSSVEDSIEDNNNTDEIIDNTEEIIDNTDKELNDQEIHDEITQGNNEQEDNENTVGSNEDATGGNEDAGTTDNKDASEEGYEVEIDTNDVGSEEINTIELNDYTVGEPINVHTINGDFSIVFNSITETTDRNLQSDFSPMRVVLVNYTVKNISYSGSLQVLPFNLKVYDYLNNEMQQYYLNTDYGEPISIGNSDEITIAYGLNSAENTIKIQYYTNTNWEEAPRFSVEISDWE